MAAPALLLLVFMSNHLGIPAAWAGVAIFVPKLLLVFVDPFAIFYLFTLGLIIWMRKSPWKT
jgi:Na+/melibiose symporter-like transporter